MNAGIAFLRRIFSGVCSRSVALWRRYRALRGRYQIGIAIILIVLLVGGMTLLRGNGGTEATGSALRTVTLASVAELSGSVHSASVLGTVRSVTSADIRAEIGGSVKSVRTTLGASVPAGFIIAEIDNASEAASLLSAEGSYDAALAARDATSLSNTTASAEDTYHSAYTSLDTTLQTEIDAFFGSPTPIGPRLLISTNDAGDTLSRARSAIDTMMYRWQDSLAMAGSRDPLELLIEAQTNVRSVSTFLVSLAEAANKSSSNATSAQLAALAAARADVDGILATLSAAEATYRNNSVGATSSADASVKQALGALRLAQANFEKTIIRAPIAGTVNFLPIRAGDYVTALTHVATVAQNGALEIVAYVSEQERASLAVGAKITVDSKYEGVITAIAPALDPTIKQIEVHAAINGAADLVNGQSVRVAFPDLITEAATEAPKGPIMLPLSAVKLSAGNRVVFTIGEDGRLKATSVTIGEVRGERIEITSDLSPDMRIVEDARGLSDGQQVKISDE